MKSPARHWTALVCLLARVYVLKLQLGGGGGKPPFTKSWGGPLSPCPYPSAAPAISYTLPSYLIYLTFLSPLPYLPTSFTIPSYLLYLTFLPHLPYLPISFTLPSYLLYLTFLSPLPYLPTSFTLPSYLLYLTFLPPLLPSYLLYLTFITPLLTYLPISFVTFLPPLPFIPTSSVTFLHLLYLTFQPSLPSYLLYLPCSFIFLSKLSPSYLLYFSISLCYVPFTSVPFVTFLYKNCSKSKTTSYRRVCKTQHSTYTLEEQGFLRCHERHHYPWQKAPLFFYGGYTHLEQEKLGVKFMRKHN